jgi:hypothetical protein
VTVPEHAESPTSTSWQAVAVLFLLLFGLPSTSFRDVALAHDWYFGPLDSRPAVLAEARKSIAKQQGVDGAAGSEAQDQDDGPPPRASSAVQSASAGFSTAGTRVEPQQPSLLPHSTGPPRA